MISATGTSNAGPGTLLGHTREFRSSAGVAKRAPSGPYSQSVPVRRSPFTTCGTRSAVADVGIVSPP